MSTVLFTLGALACLAWVLSFGLAALSAARIPRLGDLAPAEPAWWPLISVIITARDEVGTIEPALASLLAVDYRRLEVVIVDDRSTDGTRELVDALAAENPAVRAVHADRLPDGWLGKVNALERGVRVARGDWLLFSDADTHFAPGVLSKAVALALAHRLDHLTLLPRLRPTGPLQAVLMAAFVQGYVQRNLASRHVVLRDGRYFGFGSFNLVRREALARSGGLGWLRMEVLDDLGLSALVQLSGGRSGFVVTTGELEVEWYPSARATLRGFEKNAFGALAHYRLDRAVAMAAGTLVLALGPLLLVGPALAGSLAATMLLAAAGTALVVQAAVGRMRLRIGFLPALGIPVAHLLMAYTTARTAVVCIRRGGILWRGTFYPLEALRMGRRVSFP